MHSGFNQRIVSTTFLLVWPSRINNGHVDSPESPETPEITEIKEIFTKIPKYLTKRKETLINYVWEKSHVKKQ